VKSSAGWRTDSWTATSTRSRRSSGQPRRFVRSRRVEGLRRQERNSLATGVARGTLRGNGRVDSSGWAPREWLRAGFYRATSAGRVGRTARARSREGLIECAVRRASLSSGARQRRPSGGHKVCVAQWRWLAGTGEIPTRNAGDALLRGIPGPDARRRVEPDGTPSVVEAVGYRFRSPHRARPERRREPAPLSRARGGSGRSASSGRPSTRCSSPAAAAARMRSA
jgi:hypothetical protein